MFIIRFLGRQSLLNLYDSFAQKVVLKRQLINDMGNLLGDRAP